VPEPIPPRPQVSIRKDWPCPHCGDRFSSHFDGDWVWFNYAGRKFAAVRGTYLTAVIKCPICDREIEFTRDELEKEE